MFRLTSSNLPLVASRVKSAPTFTIWSENRGTAPILRVNCYGNWQSDPGWELDVVPLGSPFATGKYYRLQFAPTIQGIAQYTKVESAQASSPDTFWQSDTAICLYQNSSLPTIAKVTAVLPAPPPVANNYVIAVPGIIATTISSSGLIFASGTDIGKFSQDDDTVTIYGDAAYSLLLGQELLVTGEALLSFSAPYCTIASFYLPEVAYCDRIDWVGHSFSPALDALSPDKWEFTWDASAKIANLFLPSTSMPYFPPSQVNYISNSSGVIDFER